MQPRMKLRIRGNSLCLESRKRACQARRYGQGRGCRAVLVGSEPALWNRGARDGGRDRDLRGGLDPGGVPKARLDLWLRPDEVSVEGSQPIGGGKVLQIVLEKDDATSPGARDDD